MSELIFTEGQTSMAKHFLTLTDLKKLDDGIADVAFRDHLKRAAKDCLDRPADNKARIVTIAFKVKPDPRPDGSCDKIGLAIEVKSTVPTHKTAVYSMDAQHNGSLVFNEDSLDEIDQTTLLPDDAE